MPTYPSRCPHTTQRRHADTAYHWQHACTPTWQHQSPRYTVSTCWGVGVGTLVRRHLGALARASGCVGVLHVGEWARTVRWHVDRWVCSSWRVVVWACQRVGVCVGASSSHWCVGVSAHWCGCVGGLVHQFSTGATWHWCMVGNINEFLIGHGSDTS